MGNKRLFIGFGISAAAVVNIGNLVKELEKFDWPIRWESQDRWHITIKFLGRILESSISLVEKVIKKETKNVLPFQVRLNKLWLLPDIKHPRIICLLVEGEEGLYNLAESLTAAMGSGDIADLEKHEYLPHLTLGRFNPAPPQNFRVLKNFNPDVKFRVSSISLYESLRQERLIYRRLSTFDLSGRID